MFTELKTEVCRVNKALVDSGLVILTWGNVSGVDRKAGVMAIKPSGVPYDRLTPDDIVVLKIADGAVVEGKYRPSSDTATHLHLYRAFPNIGHRMMLLHARRNQLAGNTKPLDDILDDSRVS